MRDTSVRWSKTGALAWFLVLEAGFLGFAGVCLRPGAVLLPVSFNQHDTEVKGAFTVLFMLWQALALFLPCSAAMSIFSSEWHHIYNATATLEPGKTDKVSTLTSGSIDQFKHACLSSTSSLSFRAAFLALCAAFAIRTAAPGAISVASFQVDQAISITIGDLSVAQNTSSSAQYVMASIVDLEQTTNSTYGYTTSPSNCAVGWPSLEYLQNGSSITYQSDAMCWSHKCRWEAPDIVKKDVSLQVPSMPNATWIMQPGLEDVCATYYTCSLLLSL
jgi:hypothetical protein